MLKFKNTLSGKIEEFKPIKKAFLGKTKVGMYNCGPTVYSKAHIGNLRAYIFADLIRKTLEFNNYIVNQVVNITDVGHLTSDSDEGEDKVEAQAKKESKSAEEITQKYTDLFFNDLERLNIDRSKIKFPKATDHIDEQISLIKNLEEKKLTYKTSDGIYFDTSKYKDYGKLGHINLEGLEEGHRVESNPEKKNPTDFALWKFSGDTKRQQEWESPWGVGFPGWHLECSAMSMKYLGESFDIHTGGVDHINTHHNNEIAQSEASSNKPFAKYWLHVNHIQINGEKISKSIGNVIYLDDLEEKGFSPMSYKMFLYGAHYSTLLNFTEDSLKASQKALYKIYDFLNKTNSHQSSVVSQYYLKKFTDAINDDLNTSKAIATIFDLIADKEIKDTEKKATILKFDEVLNLGFNNPKKIEIAIPEEVTNLAEERQKARESKDWEKSDDLRDKIKELGFEIKDIPEGFELNKVI
jgi:cysteinyl-tRNA synthetase